MLKELVKKCRTYRRFYQEVPISMEELTDLVDTARLTASASNLQPLRYKLVNEPELCAQIFSPSALGGSFKRLGRTRGGRTAFRLHRHRRRPGCFQKPPL